MKKKIIALLFIGNLFLDVLHALPNAAQDPRVQKVYVQFQDHLLWIENGDWTPCAKTFFDVFARVEEEGLWGENYLPLREELMSLPLNSPETQKEADAAFTLLALTYIAEMKGKRLDPHAVDKTIYEKPEPVNEVDVLIQHLSPPHHCGWAASLAPDHEEYQSLKKLLAHYRQKKSEGDWHLLPTDTKLEMGDKGDLVKTLKKQLIEREVLAAEAEEGDTFDKTVEDSIKLYQHLHGLESDGKLGAETLKTLNRPIDERINSIIVSLERHRWLPSPLPPRYIQVNIPGFFLKAVGENDVFFMPIITGKEYRKTPVFDAPLTDIIFNPSWHVPVSIAVRDKLPKLKRNPNALMGKGYLFYTASGERISPVSINWENYSGGHFPIKIVQSPGKANALGKIRFTLDNPFSIYMHGTPDTQLFRKTKRALSSGCIRVEDPAKLAEFVLNDPEKWPLEKIKKESDGLNTKKVKLSEPLPVFVTYFTVFKKGEHWHIVPDEYEQDRRILNALEKTKNEEEPEDEEE